MKHFVYVLLTTGMMALFSTASHAYIGMCCGKCGGNMPLNIPGAGVPEPGEYRFKLSPMQMHMEGLKDGTDSVDVDDILGMPVMMGSPTGKYMAAPTAMDMTMVNAAVGHSFNDNFFGMLMLMWKKNSMDMKFNSMMASSTGQSGFTMESSGLADTMLMTKYLLYADDKLIPRSQLSLLTGLGIPTGSIDEKNSNHPMSMRQSEQLPYGMQLGSGTWDPMIGLLYSGSSSPWWWGVGGIYTARMYDNKRDYRLGNEFRINGYVMHQLRENLVAEVQLNASYKGRIQGEMDEAVTGESGHATQGDPGSPYMSPLWDTDNYGGQQLGLTIGLQWQPAPLQIINLQYSKNISSDLNGPQLENDYKIMLTWYYELVTSKSRRAKDYLHQEHQGGGDLGF